MQYVIRDWLLNQKILLSFVIRDIIGKFGYE